MGNKGLKPIRDKEKGLVSTKFQTEQINPFNSTTLTPSENMKLYLHKKFYKVYAKLCFSTYSHAFLLSY